MLRRSMVLLTVTRGRLPHLGAALVARVLAAPGGRHPFSGAARLADAVVRAGGAFREALALVTAGARSAPHCHAGVRAVTRGAGEREERQRREPNAVIGDSHHVVLLREAYM